MPIYEFLCRNCNRIYSFHSFKIDTTKVPICPRCGAEDLQRRPSSFGISTKPAGDAAPGGEGPDLDNPRMEAEMMRFASEMEHLDENDPKAMAKAVRKMTELAGEPVTPAMEEMIRRLEAGEDPDRIEEDLGDALEGEMGDEGGGGFGGAAPTQDGGLYPM
ncbi:MAG: zinc ribbon domain-containing protein [Acidobacteria bacterium]|nr:zinc ribbon domain-containing protein [Acidobacteriota bacterium]